MKGFIENYDHKLVLSEDFLRNNPGLNNQGNLITWTMEPTAENILLYIKNMLVKELPTEVQLVKMKLHETRDSFAEWVLV